MSCHTWAYRKIKPEEEKELREYIKKNLMHDYRYIPDNVTEEDYVADMWERLSTPGADEDWNLEQFEDYVSEGNLRIRENLQVVDTCDMKMLEKIYKDLLMATRYTFYKGSCYVECGFDKPVRIYGYPEEKFTDAKKFANWIKNKEKKLGNPICMLYTEDSQKTGFSEAVEKSIYDFWNKYDGNVLVEFG